MSAAGPSGRATVDGGVDVLLALVPLALSSSSPAQAAAPSSTMLSAAAAMVRPNVVMPPLPGALVKAA
jgi:hypothetical protein